MAKQLRIIDPTDIGRVRRATRFSEREIHVKPELDRPIPNPDDPMIRIKAGAELPEVGGIEYGSDVPLYEGTRVILWRNDDYELDSADATALASLNQTYVDVENVICRGLNAEPLTEGQIYIGYKVDDVIPPTVAGVADKEAIPLYHLVEVPAIPSFEYQSYTPTSTGISFTGVDTVKQEITSWVGAPNTSPTDLQFPSTGYWMCHFTVTGRVFSEFASQANAAANTAPPSPPTLYCTVLPVSTNWQMQCPGASGAPGGIILTGGYYSKLYVGGGITWAAAFDGLGTLHFSCIVKVFTANAKALKLEVWYQNSGFGTNNGGDIYGISGVGAFGVSPPTHVVMHKLADL